MTSRDWLYKKNVVIDTGPLIEYYELYLEISKNKENEKKFKLISDFLKNKKLYVVSPVFTEVYFRLRKLARKNQPKLDFYLSRVIWHLKYLNEKSVSKEEILEERSFPKFGFTDIALSKIIHKDWVFLSTDQSLINLCLSRGLDAHHTREIYYILKP